MCPFPDHLEPVRGGCVSAGSRGQHSTGALRSVCVFEQHTRGGVAAENTAIHGVKEIQGRQNRTEQNRTEQNRTEQTRQDQSRAELNGTERGRFACSCSWQRLRRCSFFILLIVLTGGACGAALPSLTLLHRQRGVAPQTAGARRGTSHPIRGLLCGQRSRWQGWDRLPSEKCGLPPVCLYDQASRGHDHCPEQKNPGSRPGRQMYPLVDAVRAKSCNNKSDRVS
eukprot:gene22775-biopygen14816